MPESYDDYMWEEQVKIERRNEILRAAADGKLSPEAAENFAAVEQLGPFAKPASRDAYDPRSRQSWTIEMVLVWIISRDFEQVIEFDEKYRRDCIGWHEIPFEPKANKNGYTPGPRKWPHVTKWELRGGHPATISEVSAASVDFKKTKMSFVEAKNQLWECLVSGSIVCSGFNIESKRIETIDEANWLHLDFRKTKKFPIEIKSSFLPLGYMGMRFSKDEILSNWGRNVGATEIFNWEVILIKARELVAENKNEKRYTVAKLSAHLLAHFSDRKDHMQDQNAKHIEPSLETLRGQIRKNNIMKTYR